MNVAKAAGLSLVVALMIGSSTALAAFAAGPAVQATIAFLNLLNPSAASAAQEAADGDEGAARLLLDGLAEEGTLGPAVTDAMRKAVASEALLRDSFVLFLADLLNGEDDLASLNVADAQNDLATYGCGLYIPPGSVHERWNRRILSHSDVGWVVRQFLDKADCFARRHGNKYKDYVE